MPAPTYDVDITDAPTPATSLTDTGQKFLAGLAHKGAAAGAISPADAITSLADFDARHGVRQSYNGPDYDSVEAFFADGGSRLFFSRIVGPAAVKASITVPAAGTQFTATAKGPGAYANGGTITITAGVATVVVDGVTEVSPAVATVGDLQNWATSMSKLIDVTPSVATTTALLDSVARTLASGADDRTNITATERDTAIARFGKNLGSGQVAMPSDPTTTGHTRLATHARDTNRFAHGDAQDTATAATVAAQGTAIRALGRELARHIQILDPWLTGPPATPGGSPRTIPPSAVHGGLTARVDAGGNPNVAVAGVNAISRFATDVKYQRTDAERDTLADAGVTVYVNDGGVQPFDDITTVHQVDEPEWLGAAGNRLVMRIIQDARAIAKQHMFGGIASQADLLAFGGDLEAMLSFWHLEKRALFSADGTANGAYRVQVLDPVNTTATLQNRQLNAAISLKLTPNSRFVKVNITNTPLTAAL